ncbi:hypothetical protein M8C21_011830 [Ambrosia artemisiifolia]|uniref:Protein kinase domain-containing protein n=1 Tax=Ambrosia artemisiifolia TaxID=4212 RepID=A0AAD5CLA7_AMBAR|nr:hypothetical protein M8C21_011830 [Ambrosia artemisiifolia]
MTNNISIPICPERFSCPGLSVLFQYPFYNVTDTRCGLIKVNCTSKGGEVQLGGQSYEIVWGNFDFDHNWNLGIWNTTFETLVKNNSCEALMNTFSFPSPNPLLYSISIFPNITLFKCTKKLNSDNHTDAYFDPRYYKSHNTCKGYTFYYSYLNGTVPSDLPHTCQVVHLPVKWSLSQGLDEGNIFTLLSYVTPIAFNLTHSCSKCQEKSHLCNTENGHVQCLEVKWEKTGAKQSRNRTITILVIAGPALILTLTFVIFITWRLCKSNRFSYVSSKNKYPNLEDISFSFGVPVFSYEELEDATQNFDPSHELGDGGFGAVYYGKLQDGREVAVKKLHEHNYNRVQQFRNEVEILTKLRHPNLVVSRRDRFG